MTRDELKEKILQVIAEVAEMHDATIISPLTEDAVLLESGLDSLGFAALVASLEIELGFDPFAEAETAFYPRTLQEFVDYYFQSHQKK